MWSNYINKDLITLNPVVKGKDELFSKMVNHAYNLDLIVKNDEFLSVLKERESKGNTQIMKDVALPHARSIHVEKLFMQIVVFRDGFDYGNSDLGDVRLVFFFGSPDNNNKEYLQLIAKSSRLLRNKEFRDGIINAVTPEDIMAVLNRHDSEEAKFKRTDYYTMKVIIHDEEMTNEVLSALAELGVTNGTISECTSIARKIAYEIPVFAGFGYLNDEKSTKTVCIESIINNRDISTKLYRILRENNIDLNNPNTGYIKLTRVEEIIGNTEENIDL